MKRLFSNNWSAKLTHNWRAKMVCFLIALVIWVLLKNQIDKVFIDQVLTHSYTVPQ